MKTQGEHDISVNPKPEVFTSNHSQDRRFFDYYAKVSQNTKTLQRFSSIRDVVLKVLKRTKSSTSTLKVVDIGCGAGTQSIMWAELGHRVYGLDINEALLGLAKERAVNANCAINFIVGSTIALPWADKSIDICLVPELLEHVPEWRLCLKEFARILRPGGILFITTTNKLCPFQDEFSLPLYSWYPTRLKHYFERLAFSTRPEIAGFAKYPAVNWFAFWMLRDELNRRGFKAMDRFDLMDMSGKGALKKLLVFLIKSQPVFRWLGHVVTPYTMVLAVKSGEV